MYFGFTYVVPRAWDPLGLDPKGQDHMGWLPMGRYIMGYGPVSYTHLTLPPSDLV